MKIHIYHNEQHILTADSDRVSVLLAAVRSITGNQLTRDNGLLEAMIVHKHGSVSVGDYDIDVVDAKVLNVVRTVAAFILFTAGVFAGMAIAGVLS